MSEESEACFEDCSDALPPPQRARPCCIDLLAQNRKLEMALEKEKQRRRKIVDAYKKLVVAYQSIFEVKEIFNNSSREDESDFDDAKENKKDELARFEHQLRVRFDKRERRGEVSVAARPKASAATRKEKPDERPSTIDSVLTSKPSTGNRHEFADQKKVLRRDATFIASSMVRKTTTTSTENVVETYRNIIESKPPENVEVEEKEMGRQNMRMLDLHHNNQQSAWYFVGFENEKRDPKDMEAFRQSRMDNWLHNSYERRRMIAETSRRRAIIAANRRAVAIDILKGNRKLDEEALQILHTDSGTISSFPEMFMRRMRSNSRKRHDESLRRLERERGNFPEKQLQFATNKIMAHTSATIAKCLARNNSRLSK